MKYTDHQDMTKIFQFSQKKLGSTAGYSTFSVEAFQDECVDMMNFHVFVTESSHSSWTELFGELGERLQEHELRGNSELISIPHRN